MTNNDLVGNRKITRRSRAVESWQSIAESAETNHDFGVDAGLLQRLRLLAESHKIGLGSIVAIALATFFANCDDRTIGAVLRKLETSNYRPMIRDFGEPNASRCMPK
jgi:hypothetical protein